MILHGFYMIFICFLYDFGGVICIAEFSDTLMPYLSVEFEQLKFFLMLNFNIRKFALLKLNIRVFFECEYKQKVLC